MAVSYPASLSDLKARVRNRLLTTSTATDHWSDTKILLALNRAQKEVQSELLEVFDSRYFTKVEEDLVPNGSIIVLPSDCLRVQTFDKKHGTSWIPVKIVDPSRAIEYRYGTPLIPLNASTSVYQEEVWSQIGDRMEAQLAAPTGTYRMRYTYLIPDLESDDDKTKIPEQYQDLLVDCAAFRCARDGSQPERAGPLEADFQANLMRMKRTAGRTIPGKVSRIRRTRGRSFWGA